VGVSQILGVNGLDLANRYILNTVKQSPGVYNSDFYGIGEGQPFYTDGEVITFIFNPRDLAPASQGVVRISMDLRNLLSVSLSSMEYYTTEDTYRLKMIPLRYVCERLRFSVDWDAGSQTAYISGGGLVTVLTLDKNSYQGRNRSDFKLEAPPSVIDGQTCVPISFFEECLGVTYKVSENGNILFSVYGGDDI
jgi:hypothetical protein